MRHQDQVAEARKLLSYLDTRTTAMADSIYRNPVSDYTCPQQAVRLPDQQDRHPGVIVGHPVAGVR